MDQSPCVLLEALKQFIDTTGATGLEATPTPLEQEKQLEDMSQKSAARAKQLLTKLCKKKKLKSPKVEEETQMSPVSQKAQVTSVSQVATILPSQAAMLLSSTEAKWEGNKLRINLQNLHAITKGRDYFSRDSNYAIDVLKEIILREGSLSVILQSGSITELRDILSVQGSQNTVEFTLGDMQVADGGELEGSLRTVQLFFGSLPSM